jgi:hypothetical protein
MLRVSFAAWTAAFTERSDGDLRVRSRAPGDPFELVASRLLCALGVDGAAVPRQVHGAEVFVVSEPLRGYAVGVGDADATVTAIPALASAVHVADCLPVAIGGKGGVAMLHCGWRGLAGGIVGEGVRSLRGLGVDGELEAVIGPGVGGCCYETGEEVRDVFTAYGASDGRLLDLKAVSCAQLAAAGVAKVHDVGLCTICTPGRRFFSHRRDGAATGRQGGFAWLR